jgi:hypothetical protein
LKVISGGQTGVDRAALDAAISCGLDYGGSVPAGRMAEDGPIDMRYTNLLELSRGTYRDRTLKNVEDGDATLIFARGKPKNGTAYTISCARKLRKPILIIDMVEQDEISHVKKVLEWFESIRPEVINIAGPRESKSPGIYGQVLNVLTSVFQKITCNEF